MTTLPSCSLRIPNFRTFSNLLGKQRAEVPQFYKQRKGNVVYVFCNQLQARTTTIDSIEV